MARKLRMGPACYHVRHLFPPMIAHEMNFFYDEGLRDEDAQPNYELVTGGLAPFMFEKETLGQRMKEQDIDIAMDVKPSTVAYLQKQGHDLYIIAGWLNQSTSQVIGQPGMDNLQDLRGKRIGVIDYTDVLVTVLSPWLKRSGIDPKHGVVWVRGVPPRESVQALRDGRIDAGFLHPLDAEMLRNEGFSLLWDCKAPYPEGRPVRIIAAAGQVLEERPQMVQAYLRAMIRAYWFMRKLPENFEQIRQLERRLRYASPDPDEPRRIPEWIPPPSRLEHLPFPYNGLPTGLAQYLEESVELGEIEDFNVERACSLGPVRQAFAELTARDDLKADLQRAQALTARLGY